MKATKDSGTTTSQALHTPTPFSVTKDLVFTVAVQFKTALADSGNRVHVKVVIDDNGTNRTLNYWIEFGGSIPSDTSSQGYFDLSADFSIDTWDRLTRNIFKDFDDKFFSL